jgi:O-antigen/teichoic acid export membrane protein
VNGVSERPADTSLENAGGDTIASGAASAFGAQVAIYALGLVTSVLIARALGPEGRGQYYLPLTAAMLVTVIFSLTLESANTFLYAERRFSLRELASNATLLAPLLGIPAAAVLVALYLMTADSLFAGVSLADVLIVAAVVPVQIHLLWTMNLFQLSRRVSRSQMALLAGAIGQTVPTAALYVAGILDVRLVLVLYAASLLVTWTMLMWWARDFAPMRPSFDRRRVRATVGLGLKLHIGLIASYLLLRADVFLVSHYLGVREVGVYSLAVLFAELVVLLTNPLVIAALPFQAEASIHEAGRLSFKAARFNLIFALALGAGFAATLWLVIPLVYGSEFDGAYPALVALLPGIAAMAVSRSLGTWLTRQERPWVLTGLGVAVFVLNLALNVVLLPVIGLVGASIASTIAYAALAAAFVSWGLRITGLPLRDVLMPTADDFRTAQRIARQAAGRLARVSGRGPGKRS